jgi:23S rRNA (guanosine2251-2'-O)-methyltransferase
MSRRKARSPHRPTADANAPDGLWLYGLHAVKAALANPERRVLRLLATANGAHNLALSSDREMPGQVEIAERRQIERHLPPGAVHQGVALKVAPLAETALDDVITQGALLVVLDQVTDPQNVGAVLRSAAAFGAGAVITTRRHAPPESGALAKAASGALELVPLVRVTNLARALEQMTDAGITCIGLDGAANRLLSASLPDLPDGGPLALVLGAEGAGLRRLTRERCTGLARLPIDERIESLNVSNAAAVALYECARKQT